MYRRVVIWRLIALAWALNMFWMSTETFSGDRSRPLLASLLDLLHINLSAITFGFLHTLLRKLAHVSEYAILASLLYLSLLGRGYAGRWCIVACSVFSLADELHQSFVPSRGPSLIDCAIDVTGAVIGLILVRTMGNGESPSLRLDPN
jgi:VanZ family protein